VERGDWPEDAVGVAVVVVQFDQRVPELAALS
jgi:hypothetical protein